MKLLIHKYYDDRGTIQADLVFCLIPLKVVEPHRTYHQAGIEHYQPNETSFGVFAFFS